MAEITLGPQPRPRPRVWTAFAAYGAAFAFAIGAQIAAVSVLVAVRAMRGETIDFEGDGLVRALMKPGVFLVISLCSQAAILLAALAPAQRSPQPAVSRLGFNRTGLPAWTFIVLMLGCLLPLSMGISVAVLLTKIIPPDPSVEILYEQMTLPWVLPFLLFISLAPGFAEEMLFRGYMQRRFLERWNAWLAIFVTTLLFAVMHVTPHAMANAFIIGFWLGIIAWKTGSIWPTVACHAFVNGAWNVYQLGVRFEYLPEVPPLIVWLPGAAVIVACFYGSASMLFRGPRAAAEAG